ncbi:28014_t:CDS:2, partial [Dentiscutata erythropus]
MDNETTICICPRCLQKNPLGVSITKKTALNHQRAFLWVQQLEEQIDDSYVNFNTRHLKKKKKENEFNEEKDYNSNLNLMNIEENEFDEEENYNYQYIESSDFNETIQLSPNLSQNSSIYTNDNNSENSFNSQDNNSENSFNSQDNIDDLYQNFEIEEYSNDILLETNEDLTNNHIYYPLKPPRSYSKFPKYNIRDLPLRNHNKYDKLSQEWQKLSTDKAKKKFSQET